MNLNRYELRCVLVIGTVISLRLLGIFLIVPVFSIYAVNYEGATLSSAGVAFGIYALTQSLLQIPFGMASDRFGRKPVVVSGLLIFCLGSVLCGFADNIWELIITRALQGSGAIGAVAIASLGDSTRSEVRAQSFMLTGIIIGTAFITSLIVGPVLAAKFGFESIFFILAALGLIATLVTLLMFPELPKRKTGTRRGILLKLKEPEVRKILSSAFITSLALNLILFIYPLDWRNRGTEPEDLWFVYLVILAPSALLANAYIRISERRKTLGKTTRFGLFFLVASFLIYLLPGIWRRNFSLPRGGNILSRVFNISVHTARLCHSEGLFREQGNSLGLFQPGKLHGCLRGWNVLGHPLRSSRISAHCIRTSFLFTVEIYRPSRTPA